ncbi:unnamed protein product [Fusarium equiseti]|uniref:GPI inositol-deacylase winged helix domain-containing protein n=1 Tax=Fusarium equiseti TaxID=61235 RepID=A0A8J2J353_FUSEQ|nr:unnamed protein product [Fusarium equiseti]
MDGLSAAASLIAVIQAIQMVISLCAPYLSSTNTTKHEIRRLQVELQTLTTIFEGVQRLLKSSVGARLDISQALNNTLHDCLCELERLATKLKTSLDVNSQNKLWTNIRLRLKWPLASKDVDATIQTLSKFRDGLCVCLNVDQMSLLLSNYERTESIEQMKLLDTISTVPYETHHHTIREARVCNTCEWITHLGIVIHAGNNQEDIRIFIQKAITAHRRWGKISVDLRDHILQVLTTRSNGMFQWAYLQIMQLLSLLTEAAILDRLGKLPSNLKATYDEMYTQITARNQYDKALADRALMWVMCAPRYLTSTELLSAIRFPSDDGEFYMAEDIDDDLLLDLCNDLLIFDAHQKVWKFPHASVLEYLEENRYSILKAHSHVAKACLGLLIGSYKELGGGFINEFQSMRHHDAEAVDIFDPKHPLQHYCRNHWIYHVYTQRGLRPDPGLSNLLMEFIGTPMESSAYFRSWFQAVDHDFDFRPLRFKSFLTRELMSQISPCSVGLFAACRLSLISFMEGWLDDETIPLGITNCLGDNVITLAMLSGWTTTCETLLHRGFPIDSGFRRHVSPVDPSHARRSSIDTIDIVTSQAQDELADDYTGRYGNALAAAAVQGYIPTVKCLLKHGAEVDLYSTTYGSALIAASTHGNIDVARLLLDNGADVDFNRGPLGSALAAASELSNIDMVRMLLNNRASINLKNEDSGSALTAAASMGRIEVVQLLLEEGANVDLQAGYYGTALAAAALHRHQDVISLLIQRGADVNLQICAGEFSNALDAAAASGSTMIIKHLLRHGAASSQNTL